MVDKVVNVARSTLASTINATDDPVTFSVAAGEGGRFALDGAETLVLTICKPDGTGLEVLRQSARSGDTLTATRAIEAPAGGTITPVTHGPGDLVAAIVSAGQLTALINSVPTLIPGADPTGATDSTAAVTTYFNGLAAGSTVTLAPAEYALAGTRLALAMQPNITIFSYGVKFFQNTPTDNKIFTFNDTWGLRWHGLEIYGILVKTRTGAHFTGSASGTALADCPRNSGTVGSQTPSGQPDSVSPTQAKWYARNKDGNYLQDWQLSQAGTPGTSDCLVVNAQCARDQAPPNVAPQMAVIAGNGQSWTTAYYAWAFLMRDGYETGIGPIGVCVKDTTHRSITVTNGPTNAGAGVVAYKLYRCQVAGTGSADPTVNGNWYQVGTVILQTADGTWLEGSITDSVSSVSGLDVMPPNTSIRTVGPLTGAAALYRTTHPVMDDEQQIRTLIQRITPAASNTVTVTNLKETGVVVDGGTADIDQDVNDLLVVGDGCRNMLFADPIIEGAGGGNVNIAADSESIGVEIRNPRLRACGQNVLSISCGKYHRVTGYGYIGEAAHSTADDEPETISTFSGPVFIGPVKIRNWDGSGFGFHCNSWARNLELTFDGTIFETWVPTGEAINRGAQTLKGRIYLNQVAYNVTATAPVLTLAGMGVDLDCMVSGKPGAVNLVTGEAVLCANKASQFIATGSESGGTATWTSTDSVLGVKANDKVRFDNARELDFVGGSAWQTLWLITGATGSPGAYTITATTLDNTTGLASGTFTHGACLKQLWAGDAPTGSHVSMHYSNVTLDDSQYSIDDIEGSIDVSVNGSTPVTYTAAGITGYIGTTSGTPPARALPYAAGAYATDPAGKMWICTVAGSAGTWKSVNLS